MRDEKFPIFMQFHRVRSILIDIYLIASRVYLLPIYLCRYFLLFTQLLKFNTRNPVTGHQGHFGSEKGDASAQTGTASPFIGPELFRGISKCVGKDAWQSLTMAQFLRTNSCKRNESSVLGRGSRTFRWGNLRFGKKRLSTGHT